jgi:aryl-phospho-beta-D-glucosidase BglC (GH1 family)
MLKQIRELGFNTVRIPWCDAMLASGAKAASVNTDGADPYDSSTPMNEPLMGKTPLEILDLVVETAGELGLKLILDNHSRKPDGYMEEKVWYTDTVSEEQWIANWVFMADRYRGNPTVIGFDLDNEPHGEASWATGNAATDWDAAAERCGNAILAANPDALIIVEGVEKVGTDGYWWGGNLSGARANPIELTRPEKLVYSAHEYGPEVFAQKWFTDASFPNNLPEVWNRKFGFLMKENLGHVFIGEFGIKDPAAAEGSAGTWFKSFLEYAGTDFSFTFWCWNPNSGDTEGILEYDWLTPKQWKLDALKPYLAPQFK